MECYFHHLALGIDDLGTGYCDFGLGMIDFVVAEHVVAFIYVCICCMCMCMYNIIFLSIKNHN